MHPIVRKTARLGLAAFSLSGMTSLIRRKQSGACIIMYHGLVEGTPSGLENHSRLHLDVEGFRKSARLFAKNYNVIPLQELADLIREEKPIPANTVVLTFDDGYASNYHLGLPILEEFGLHATVFSTTGFIEGENYQWPDRIEYAIDKTSKQELNLDFPGLPCYLDLHSQAAKSIALINLDEALKSVPQERHLESIDYIEEQAGVSLKNESSPADIYRPMTWEQLRAVEASPYASIGAHTHSHCILGKYPIDMVRHDMERCVSLLREKGGIENPTFAYPNGKLGDFNDATHQVLSDLGISVAVSTEIGFNDGQSDLMSLMRMGSPNNAFEADTICSGIIPTIKNWLSSKPQSSPQPPKSAHANV